MLNIFRTFFSIAIVFLIACGQKGPLYLSDKTMPAPSKDEATFTMKKDEAISPDLVTLKPLNIVGRRAQINSTTPPSWQAVLMDNPNTTNLIRYIAFNDNILADKTPLKMLIGTINKASPNKDQSNTTIQGGSYLRFRSLETGFRYIPTLVGQAKIYLKQHPELKHLPKKDFLTDTRYSFDLYIAVEVNP